MWKLIRGILWVILSVSFSLWSYLNENGWLQLSIFILCIGVSISLLKDGWDEYKLIKKK